MKRTIAWMAVQTAMVVALFATTLALSAPTFTHQQVMTASSGQLIDAQPAAQTRDAVTIAVLTLKAESVTIDKMKINKPTYTTAPPDATNAQTIGNDAPATQNVAHTPPPAEKPDTKPILRS